MAIGLIVVWRLINERTEEEANHHSQRRPDHENPLHHVPHQRKHRTPDPLRAG